MSEYFCNRAYPKYQHLERQLRHLVFKVVTKAYGELWTSNTLSKDLKKTLKDEVRSRTGSSREDVLIEEALHEMTMTQMIDYLFFGPVEINMPEYLDDFYSNNKLQDLSKNELITLIEKSRRRSVWNMFLAKDIDIDEPKGKLMFLRNNRNNVAHCKKFHYYDYTKSIEYINLFVPKIEEAIENATIPDSISAKDVVLGFGDFAINLANTAIKIGETLSPALIKLSEVCTSVAQAFQTSYIDKISKIIETTIPKINMSFWDKFANTLSLFNNIQPTTFLIDQNSESEDKDDMVEVKGEELSKEESTEDDTKCEH